MAFLHFECPPFPSYLASGKDTYSIGQSHINRANLGVFDLLCVTRGTLYMGEEERTWEVKAGHVLILQPDRHHYSYRPCTEETQFFWLHFQVFNDWWDDDELHGLRHRRVGSHKAERSDDDRLNLKWFKIQCPQFVCLSHPDKSYRLFHNLLELEYSPQTKARWQQQLIFQEIVLDLHSSSEDSQRSSVQAIAEQAATYIRKNYQRAITHTRIREALNFHPTYVSRCMKQVYGVTLNDYLNHYRIEQAALQLQTTHSPIHEIAEQVGYQNLSYFARKFHQIKGVKPSLYRRSASLI